MKEKMPKVVVKDSNKVQSAHCQTATPGSTKGICAASEAILDIQAMGDGKLLLIMAHGWEHVFAKHGQDDPGGVDPMGQGQPCHNR